MRYSNIQAQLARLEQEARQIDKKRGESKKPLFDVTVFRCLAHFLTPCVRESQQLLDQIKTEQANQRLSSAHAGYLCQRLVHQISALQREMATQNIRATEYSIARQKENKTLNLNDLHDNLSKHQGWQRELELQIIDATKLLEKCNNHHQKSELEKRIAKTEIRLEKCKASKKKIETLIARAEQQHNDKI